MPLSEKDTPEQQCPRRQTKREILLHLDKSQLITQKCPLEKIIATKSSMPHVRPTQQYDPTTRIFYPSSWEECLSTHYSIVPILLLLLLLLVAMMLVLMLVEMRLVLLMIIKSRSWRRSSSKRRCPTTMGTAHDRIAYKCTNTSSVYTKGDSDGIQQVHQQRRRRCPLRQVQLHSTPTWNAQNSTVVALTSIINFCQQSLSIQQLNLLQWIKLNQENFPRIKQCMKD